MYVSGCVMSGGCWQKDEEEELIRRAQEGMNAEECQFSVEFPVKQEALIWSDKYRPRKPRFFNRVHTVCCSTSRILLCLIAFCFWIVVLMNDCNHVCSLWSTAVVVVYVEYRDLNGTSTTRHIMMSTIHLRRLYKDTSSM